MFSRGVEISLRALSMSASVAGNGVRELARGWLSLVLRLVVFG
jgi:hypothetical protein